MRYKKIILTPGVGVKKTAHRIKVSSRGMQSGQGHLMLGLQFKVTRNVVEVILLRPIKHNAFGRLVGAPTNGHGGVRPALEVGSPDQLRGFAAVKRCHQQSDREKSGSRGTKEKGDFLLHAQGAGTIFPV